TFEEAAHAVIVRTIKKAETERRAKFLSLSHTLEASCSSLVATAAMAQLVGVERRAARASERADSSATPAAYESAKDCATACAHGYRQLIAMLLPEGTTARLA